MQKKSRIFNVYEYWEVNNHLADEMGQQLNAGVSAQIPEEHASRVQSSEENLTQSQVVLKRLLAAHEAWFDVSRDFTLSDRTFPGFAAFHANDSRYVGSKKVKLWEANSHEYILFDIVEHLEKNAFLRDVDFVKTEGLQLVTLGKDHMSTNLSLVIIADSTEEGIDAVVRGVHWRKNYLLGFKGWTDLRCAVVDLSRDPRKRIITNAAGKQLRQALEANAALPVAN